MSRADVLSSRDPIVTEPANVRRQRLRSASALPADTPTITDVPPRPKPLNVGRCGHLTRFKE